MRDLSRQRCFNHPAREAAAQCPGCTKYYCRECVVDHENVMVCASCLGGKASAAERRNRVVGAAARIAQMMISIIALWLFFYFIGEGLLALPSSFHEGTIWHSEVQAP